MRAPPIWKDWSQRFNRLSRRERGMALAAVLVGLVMGSQTLVFDPLLAKRKAAQASLQAGAQELAGVEPLLRMFDEIGQEPSPADRAALDGLLARQAEQEARLASIRAGLVPARDMPGVLHELLGRHPRIHLLAMRSRPPEPLGGSEGSGQKLYRHELELTLRGSYADLVAYVAALEAMRPRLGLSALHLDARRHPDIDLGLELVTLSLDDTWLAY